MRHQPMQITLYPTPAPAVEELLYEVEVVPEVTFVCEKLFLERWPLKRYDRHQTHRHFLSLAEIMTFEHHVELSLSTGILEWTAVLKELTRLLPQFVWVRCRTAPKTYGRNVYYFDFVPIALREEGFPFDLNMTRSIEQQLAYPPEEALPRLCSLLTEQLAETAVDQPDLFQEASDVNKPSSQESETEEVQSFLSAGVKPLMHRHAGHPSAKEIQQKNHQLILYQEEIKREKYAKEHLRIANEKLELMMGKMEQAMMYGGLVYLESTEGDTEDWHKRIKISLREYSYLMQKAKYLEQVWKLNGELVTKSERMTVSENRLIYERDQINHLKETISSSEIYLVLDECKLIESRSVVKHRPWFRKPYVKLMKMDYDSLLNKSAYFDLLQGESFLLEQLTYESQDAKEAGEVE